MNDTTNMRKPRFSFLTGDVNWMDYGGKWVSQRMNNGEFDFWLVLELVNMDDACGRHNEGQPKYHASLCAVSPEQAAGELDRAFACCGLNEGEHKDNPLVAVECLHSYGVHAVLWQDSGNNAHRLMRQAKHEAMITCGFMFGFAMDRAQNKIGTTGWEAIRGDLTAGLARTIASGSTEGRILGKMYGVAS